MFALVAAITAFIWAICDLADLAVHFPFLAVFLMFLALHLAYAIPLPTVRRAP